MTEQIYAIVARFQVPTLTPGHKHLLRHALGTGKKVVVVLGVAPQVDSRNPLTFEMRRDMVELECPEVYMVLQHPDRPGDNETWSKGLDHLLRTVFPTASIALVAGRDSFKPFYTGELNVQEVIQQTFHPAGTVARAEVTEDGPLNSQDFRRGIIWAVEHYVVAQFPYIVYEQSEKGFGR